MGNVFLILRNNNIHNTGHNVFFCTEHVSSYVVGWMCEMSHPLSCTCCSAISFRLHAHLSTHLHAHILPQFICLSPFFLSLLPGDKEELI